MLAPESTVDIQMTRSKALQTTEASRMLLWDNELDESVFTVRRPLGREQRLDPLRMFAGNPLLHCADTGKQAGDVRGPSGWSHHGSEAGARRP